MFFALLQGANSGIGESVALHVAKCGGTIHMVCRNAQTAEDAKSSMMEKTGNQVCSSNDFCLFFNLHRFQFFCFYSLRTYIYIFLILLLQEKFTSLPKPLLRTMTNWMCW